MTLSRNQVILKVNISFKYSRSAQYYNIISLPGAQILYYCKKNSHNSLNNMTILGVEMAAPFIHCMKVLKWRTYQGYQVH